MSEKQIYIAVLALLILGLHYVIYQHCPSHLRHYAYLASFCVAIVAWKVGALIPVYSFSWAGYYFGATIGWAVLSALLMLVCAVMVKSLLGIGLGVAILAAFAYSWYFFKG
jgi:hypothetical protein